MGLGAAGYERKTRRMRKRKYLDVTYRYGMPMLREFAGLGAGWGKLVR